MASWTNVYLEVLIHLNDQPAGPIAPNARLRTQTEATNTAKVWKMKDVTTVLTLAKMQ